MREREEGKKKGALYVRMTLGVYESERERERESEREREISGKKGYVRESVNERARKTEERERKREGGAKRKDRYASVKAFV